MFDPVLHSSLDDLVLCSCLYDIRGHGSSRHVMGSYASLVLRPIGWKEGAAWDYKAPGASALNWRGRRIKSRLMSSRCVRAKENRGDGAAADFQGKAFPPCRQLTCWQYR